MNYIYDILLNLQKKDYDFYEWNLNDKIIHIRKIPLIKVQEDLFHKIVSFDFVVNEQFLRRISNRTEFFTNKNIKIIKHICLFTDGKDAIAIKFNNSGKKDKVSRILLDEQEDILDVAYNMQNEIIDVVFDNKIKFEQFKTRIEQEKYNYIIKEFNKRNYEKLKYTYFECFNINEIQYKKIVKKLKFVLDNEWGKYHEKIYDILNLSSANRSTN